MSRRLTILATLAALQLPYASAAMAGDKPPPVIERTVPWVVNYDPDSCSVASAFGADDKRLIMRLTWFKPSDTFQLLLAGKALPRGVATSPVDITFGPGSATQHATSMNGTSGDLAMIVVVQSSLHYAGEKPADTEIPDVTPEQEKAVQWLDLRIDGKHRRLALTSMGPLMAAVRTCTRDLVKSWGFDPAVQKSLTSRPKPDNQPGMWVTSSDFPAGALLRGANGIVRFRLDVDANGRVSDCHVLRSVQAPDFEKITCDLIRKRALFKPALDAGGRPVASYYVNTVRWVMPQ